MCRLNSVSEEELSLLLDQQFLLTKRVIDEKVTRLLLESQQQLRTYIQSNHSLLLNDVPLNSKKVAKGENYKSLPYWVSDFPAIMGKQDIWSFRTVVWWGHEISFNLILKGKYRPDFDSLLIPETSTDILYNTHSDPWKLELTPDFTVSFDGKHTERLKSHYFNSDFIKLTTQISLTQINLIPELSVSSFDKLITALNNLA